MWIDQTPVSCRSCGHQWSQEMLQDVGITVWLAHVKSIDCPQCGASWKQLSFGLAEPTASET